MHVSPENNQLDPRDGPRPKINARGPLNDGMVRHNIFKMSAEVLPSTTELCDAKAASIRPELFNASLKCQFSWIGNGIFQDVHDCSAVRDRVLRSATKALLFQAEICQVDDRWCIPMSQP